MPNKGWTVIEQCRVTTSQGGERLDRYPRTRTVPTKEDAEADMQGLTPEHGGELYAVPLSALAPPAKRKMPRGSRRR